MQFIAFIFVPSYIVIIFLLWIFFHHKYRKANNSVIITIGFSVLDVFTDIFSTIQLYYLGTSIWIAAAMFLIIPCMINHILTWIFMYKLLKNNPSINLPRRVTVHGRNIELRDPRFTNSFSKEPPPTLQVHEWMKQNYVLCSFVVIISTFNIENLSFISSNLLDNSTLKIPWPGNTENIIRIIGLLTNIFEDIPQLIIQISFAASTYDNMYDIPNIILASIISSFLALIFSLVKRMLLTLLTLTTPQQSTILSHARTSNTSPTIDTFHIKTNPSTTSLGNENVSRTQSDPSGRNTTSQKLLEETKF